MVSQLDGKMKLLRYLKEDDDKNFNILKQRCKKILDIYKKTKLVFYRGIKISPPDDFQLLKVRKDRLPKDTSMSRHVKLDNYFYDRFGYKARSNVIFVTSNVKQADEYGHKYIIFPVGDDWTTIWSKSVKDLVDIYSDEKIHNRAKYLTSYQLGHEEQALMSGNEVMIVNCDEYYVLRYNKNNLATLAKMLNINNNNYFNRNDWEGGTWHGGWWHDGTWKKGTWKKGTWENGTWFDGTWEDGIWKDGWWKNGTWKNGRWLSGIWYNGTWNGGIWLKGGWLNGIWNDGLWTFGTWHNGIWKDGTWKNGWWKKGTWEDGTWEDGTWEGGIWKGGIWIKGLIFNRLTKRYEESDINPTEFYKRIGYKK